MPELPEVETIRRGLDTLLRGRRVEHVEILDPRLVAPAPIQQVERLLTNRSILDVGRRGKYLLIRMSGDLVALHHLRMTGSFAAPGSPVPSHVRMRYHIGMDAPLVYNDPRRFGTLLVDDAERITAYLDARLGPEPLDPAWTAERLRSDVRGRATTIKAVLLDQRMVAGLGNIYVDEACFRAHVRPDARAASLSAASLSRLVDEVRAVLYEAIERGGSTLRDYRGVEGDLGGMQERFLAYARAGKACLRCGATMRGARIAGRSTSWCPHCQRGR